MTHKQVSHQATTEREARSAALTPEPLKPLRAVPWTRYDLEDAARVEHRAP